MWFETNLSGLVNLNQVKLLYIGEVEEDGDTLYTVEADFAPEDDNAKTVRLAAFNQSYDDNAEELADQFLGRLHFHLNTGAGLMLKASVIVAELAEDGESEEAK